VFKHNPLPFHKDAKGAAQATIAAGKQGKFWEYHDKLFANQKALSLAQLDGYAQELGLNMGKFKKDMNSAETAAQIAADQKLAQEVQARGTPNSFVNGRQVSGARPFADFKGVIDEEIKKAKAKVTGGISRANLYASIIQNGKVFKPLEDKVNKLTITNTSVVKGNPNAKIKLYEFSDFQ
jgi:protein-disulfide isomerase